MFIKDVGCQTAMVHGGEISLAINTRFLLPDGNSHFTTLIPVIMTKTLAPGLNNFDQYQAYQKVSTLSGDVQLRQLQACYADYLVS